MTSTQPSAGAVGTPGGEWDGVIHTEDLTKVYPGTDFGHSTSVVPLILHA